MLRRKVISAALLTAILLPATGLAQMSHDSNAVAAKPAGVYTAPAADIDRIKDEGMNHSQVMQTLSYLTDVIGQRLTGSPSLVHANNWTRDTMSKWGMQNAHLEQWGPFGRGWVLNGFNAQISSPYAIPLIGYPKAWSPSTHGAVNADVVYLDAKDDATFEAYKGKLRGKIVLISDAREMKPDFTGIGKRVTDEELAKMAAAPDPATVAPPTPSGTPSPAMMARIAAFQLVGKRLLFAFNEGAAVVIDNSRGGFGGTVFVQQASAAQEPPADPRDPNFKRLNVYEKEAESRLIPQMTLATENYNRLIRMIQQGEPLKMTVNIDTSYVDGDGMVSNTIAEIPGTDPKLKDQIVMLGGHMDSWQAGTGATDNGAGVAVAMEAARILMAAGLKPRRTVRVALWTGEEQGLLGSRAYVKQHFGELKGAQNFFAPAKPDAPAPEMIKGPEYEKLSAYYNLDNGTGKIRGVYMQGNSAVRPYFEAWLAPFASMGAGTLTLSNTGGTDHLSYNSIGLPGFQFIQDEIEYDTMTHHSNQDVFDRIQPDDLKQASTIMAAFVYQTAMMDEMMPRKERK